MLRLLLILLSTVFCSDNSTLLLSVPENVYLRQNSFAYPVTMSDNFPKCGSYSYCDVGSSVLRIMHLKGMIDQAPTEVEWELFASRTTCDNPSVITKIRAIGKLEKYDRYYFKCEDVYGTIDSSVYSAINCPEVSADVEFPLMTTTCRGLKTYRSVFETMLKFPSTFAITPSDNEDSIEFVQDKYHLVNTDTCKKVEEESGVNWVVIVLVVAIVIIVIVIVVMIAIIIKKKKTMQVKKTITSQTV